MLKVLLVAKLNTGNRYTDDLYNALIKENLDLTISLDEFWNSDKHYNIIHIQWIESLFNWDMAGINSSKLSQLEERFEILKQFNTKIVLTLHNKLPHRKYKNSSLLESLFIMVFKYCDGIIHLGEYSKNNFTTNFSNLKNTLHEAIPHGNYLSLPNSISKIEARKLLNIKEDKLIILIFGAIRKKEEYNLIIKTIRNTKDKNILFLANRWDSRQLSTRNKILHFLNRSKSKFQYNFVQEKDIQQYMNACDLVFVPRVNTLNSGNLYMGFSFKKIVIGPSIGNIKEVLLRTENPIFDPNNFNSVIKAIEKAKKLLETNLPLKNLTYVKTECSWNLIARKHLEFYNKL